MSDIGSDIGPDIGPDIGGDIGGVIPTPPTGFSPRMLLFFLRPLTAAPPPPPRSVHAIRAGFRRGAQNKQIGRD